MLSLQLCCNYDNLLQYLAVNYLDRFLSCQGMLVKKLTPWCMLLKRLTIWKHFSCFWKQKLYELTIWVLKECKCQQKWHIINCFWVQVFLMRFKMMLGITATKAMAHQASCNLLRFFSCQDEESRFLSCWCSGKTTHFY